MLEDFYETDRAVAEYLLFHYGEASAVMPHAFGPADAIGFPARCVSECVDGARLPRNARGLDLGCAVGRTSFELARHCAEVVGVDYSQKFVATSVRLQERGVLEFAYPDEGDILRSTRAVVPEGIDRSRVSFEHGDAMALPDHLGAFDVVMMANLIDRLREPRRCLDRLPGLVNPGGQLVIASPYTWLEAYTPREHWLGGFEREGRSVSTLDSLTEILDAEFELVATRDLPFLIREHARKFQWSVAEASLWTRRAC